MGSASGSRGGLTGKLPDCCTNSVNCCVEGCGSQSLDSGWHCNSEYYILCLWLVFCFPVLIQPFCVTVSQPGRFELAVGRWEVYQAA